MNNYVLIILLWVFILSSCQSLTFKGKVINQEGEIIDTVTIIVKNKNLKTTSDKDGKFTMGNVNLDDTIIFSKPGYFTQQIVYEPMLDGRELKIIMVYKQD